MGDHGRYGGKGSGRRSVGASSSDGRLGHGRAGSAEFAVEWRRVF